METQKKLTKRQYALRRYLYRHRSEWSSSKTIFENVPGYERASTAYKQINDDYKAINESGIFDKIIIADRVLGYKLATKKEFKEYARRLYAESIRKIVYVNNLLKAARMDGQGIIPGLEGYQRSFYDRFVEEESKAQTARPAKTIKAKESENAK